MEIVGYIAGAVLFFALVMVSIALHEAGHMFWGKLFGVKTTQFFVGFGKTLWSFHPRWRGRVSETEFGIKAVPLGGFVRFIGMLPPAKEDPDGAIRASSTGIFTSISESARADEWEEITPADEGRLFYQKKPWQKLIIMAGGPMVNLLIAFVLLWILIGTQGILMGTTTVDTVSECVVPAGSSRTCTDTDPTTPAARSGIRPGDTILTFNGTTITGYDQLSDLIRANLDKPATVVVERDGQQMTLTTVNTVMNGVASRWDPTKTVQAGFFGVSFTQEVVRGGPLMTLQQMWTSTKQTVYFLGQFPVRVYNVAADLLTGKERDAYSPMSIVGASRVAGEIAVTNQLTTGDKVAAFTSLLASVNLFVGLFNFVPLLPLDGGHIVGALWEWLRRGIARVFRRSGSTRQGSGGYVDIAKLMPLTYVVAGFILICGVVLVLADIIDPIRLFS